MGIPDGAHTHGSSGGSGLGMAVLVLVIAAVAVKLAGPVAAAVGELLRVVLIVAGVLLGVAGAGLVALVAFRVRRWRAGGTTRVSLPAPPPWRAVQRGGEPRPAIERPQEVHLHLHGILAEDVAAIIARQGAVIQRPDHGVD